MQCKISCMALGHFPVPEYMLLVLLLLCPLWLLRLLLLMLLLWLLLLSLSLLHVPARCGMVFLMGHSSYTWEWQSLAQGSIASSRSGRVMFVCVSFRCIATPLERPRPRPQQEAGGLRLMWPRLQQPQLQQPRLQRPRQQRSHAQRPHASTWPHASTY